MTHSETVESSSSVSGLYRFEKETDAKISGILNELTWEELKDLLQTLRERRALLHIQPEFTPEVVGVSKQILTFGAAGIALIVGFAPQLQTISAPWLKILACLGLLYINLMIASILVLAWFLIQARSRYPFLYLKTLGNARPFFYYQTVDLRRSWSPLHTAARKRDAVELYLKGLDEFVSYLAKEESLLLQVKNELQQYYLLIVYQGYLDQYELQLVNIFLYSVAGGVVSVLSLFLFVL